MAANTDIEATTDSYKSPAKLQEVQQNVDDVVDIMRDNVQKVLERDEKLSELDRRADALQEGGKQFEQQAMKLKRKYWWQNVKMMVIIGILGSFLLIIVIVSIVYSSAEEKENP